MKKFFSTHVKLIFAFALALIIFAAYIFADNYLLKLDSAGSISATTAGGSQITGSNWMSYVKDGLSLSQISIPGTHDSSAAYVSPSYFLRCQNTSIATQLENGYRYLDLRVAIGTNNGEAALVMKHSFATCRASSGVFASNLYFTDVLSSIYSFLEENPTETVIICVKAEDDDDAISDIQRLLYQQIDANPDSWYLANEIPTLSEVRGKIVLCTRFDDELGLGQSRCGISLVWDEQDETTPVETPYSLSQINRSQSFWVQDRYNYSIDDKVDALLDGLDNCLASENTFFLNFASTTGSGIVGHPMKYATAINQTLLDYNYQSNTCYGIVIMDYGNAELAYAIYSTNLLED